MGELARKHVSDIRDYITGNKVYQLHPDAATSWVYPLDLEFTLDNETLHYSPKDDAGIPVLVYKTVGRQYNPTRIAAYALAHFNRHHRISDDVSRREFLRAADWFASAKKGEWLYHFDWMDLKAPWLSCMAQGEGISVLTRAYRLTSAERYLDQARQAARTFTIPVGAGGVRSRLGNDDFLEEYPTSNPAHVLNGFLYALIGIHDLMRIDASVADELGFKDLVATLQSNVMKWDLEYWSAYDLSSGPGGRRNATTLAYHDLQIAQLDYLGLVLDSSELRRVADRWTSQRQVLPYRIRALSSKLLYRFLVPAQR
jgi:heparosan-N-sulfate-glucuronate 5-epimerase